MDASDSFRGGKRGLGVVLGSGGMGMVYAARNESGPVAVKVLHPERARDPYARARFADEVIAGSIVQHPRLGSVIDHGTFADGTPYLVMQRVPGTSLATIIEREGTPSLVRAVAMLQQLLDGLAALHAAGIVHGDVKTDNLLLDPRTGAVTLIDFGLASVAFAREPRCAGDLISGTPAYMAPEVIRGEPRSPASDLYGAGVILYELVTGAPPFTGATATQIFERRLRDDVVPPALIVPDRDVPPILERIVLRALAKEPEDRYANAGAFARALAIALPALDDRPHLRPEPSRTWSDAPTLEWPHGSLDAQ